MASKEASRPDGTTGRTAARLLGLGTAVPRFSVETAVSARFAAHSLCVGDTHSRKVQALYRRSGIQRRGSVLLQEEPAPETVEHEFYPPAQSECDKGPSTRQRNDRYACEAPSLAQQAAEAALQNAELDADAITHLITVSCTGFAAPGIDIALIERLGLPRRTERLQIGFMGCHAAINGFRAAAAIANADPQARVLVCCVELCSLHMQYGTDADKMVSNALFADGAGAAIIGAGEDESPAIARTGSYLVPESTDAMTWRIGDHGFEMTLSAQVPSLIEQNLASFLTDWLAEQNESLESIGGWAVHPGGPRILSSVQSALHLPDGELEIPRQILSTHGNMSSATLLFILKAFATANQARPWLLMGFGPGLEVEVALMK